jgi:hypothetical protein
MASSEPTQADDNAADVVIERLDDLRVQLSTAPASAAGNSLLGVCLSDHIDAVRATGAPHLKALVVDDSHGWE